MLFVNLHGFRVWRVTGHSVAWTEKETAQSAEPQDEYEDLDNSPRSDGPTELQVTKTMASNMQYLMNDLRAYDVALKFIKLPLRRKPTQNPSLMPEAMDPARLEIFNQAFQFLRHFMVRVGTRDALDAKASGRVCSMQQLCPHALTVPRP